MRLIIEIDDKQEFRDDDGNPTTAFDKVVAALDFCGIPTNVCDDKHQNPDRKPTLSEAVQKAIDLLIALPRQETKYKNLINDTLDFLCAAKSQQEGRK